MIIEFLMGGGAACGAGLFTNPLEVVKTRMQLQGELKARGRYAVHYRNVFHAFYNIGKVDGILALQKGLVPALWYQFFMNGIRLGVFQWFTNVGLTKDKEGNISMLRCVLGGATAGVLGAIGGSPIYMVKTQLQSSSAKEIAVGYQHPHRGMMEGLTSVYRQHGVRGLYRGVSGSIPRVMVGSATQLTTFSKCREYVENLKIFAPGSVFNALTASMMSGVVVVLFMTPFDVVSTRLYNQGTDAAGRGLLYRNVFDCFAKSYRKEGLWGFYKGWGASLFRLGPHTVLTLVFWDRIRAFYLKAKQA